MASDIRNWCDPGLIPQYGIGTTTSDKRCALSKMSEMKNTQVTSVRDSNSEAWMDYYYYLNHLDTYMNLTRRNAKEN